MRGTPAHRKIYHITHVSNLPQIVAAALLWSDAQRIELGLGRAIVGMPDIKQRRLMELPVKCHPGTKVGEYVPFYFCPRSIMLYILYKGNHPDLTYTGGQRPIVHIVADLEAVVAWANAKKRPWAFSDRNAGTRYADFYADLADLDKVNWTAVQATDFRDAVVKEGKQAEFLLFQSFPMQLVETIGVIDVSTQVQVREALREATYQPAVRVEPGWYF